MTGDDKAKGAQKRAQGRTLGEFGALHPAEKKLLEACRIGELARIGETRPENKTAENSIRPAFLRFLALGGDVDAPVHDKGVQLQSGWIDDDIDLESCRVSVPLYLWNCTITGALIVRSADLRNLALDGSKVQGLDGDGLRCRGAFFLRNGFHTTGQVRLPGARIGGDFSCNGGRFEAGNRLALLCDGINASGNTMLGNGFHATGGVNLHGAHIGGILSCRGGQFDGAGKSALSCDGIEIESAVFLDDGFHAIGAVRFVGANIGNDLTCSGGVFECSSGDALILDKAQIGGNVYLNAKRDESRTFSATGTVR